MERSDGERNGSKRLFAGRVIAAEKAAVAVERAESLRIGSHFLRKFGNGTAFNLDAVAQFGKDRLRILPDCRNRRLKAAVRGLHGRPGRNPLRHGLIDASRPIGNGGNERRLCLLIRGLSWRGSEAVKESRAPDSGRGSGRSTTLPMMIAPSSLCIMKLRPAAPLKTPR